MQWREDADAIKYVCGRMKGCCVRLFVRIEPFLATSLAATTRADRPKSDFVVTLCAIEDVASTIRDVSVPELSRLY
jgi:hypothetical protein